MRLVLVADTFPPLRTSGAVQLRDLSREFAQQGHDLTVILPSDGTVKDWELDDRDGIQILRLRAPKIKDVGYIQRTIGEYLMPYWMGINFTKSPLANAKWDGVVWYSPSIFHGPFVKRLKRASKCKSYLIIRDIFPEWALDLGLMQKGPAYYFFKGVARGQYATANFIGVQSEGNLSYFQRWARGGRGRKLEILQNWLSPPASLRCSLNIDSTILAGRKVLVYAGNMGIAQGLDIVISLAERMRARSDIGFLLIGRGSEASRLEQRSRDLALDNILFQPEIDPDEIPSLYQQCAIGIVSLDPRHRSHNIPGKFLTYMQNGLPALAVVNPGNDLASLIRNEGVGRACETADLSHLENLCSDLISELDRNPEVKLRCESLFSKRFSVDNVVRQITSALST